MVDWVADVFVPIGTFVAGIFLENFRQAKTQKAQAITDIENLLRSFLEKIAQKSKIYELKFHYNTIVKGVETYCCDYGLEKSFLNDNIIDLNIYAFEKRDPNKVSEISILLINKIKSY
jgi:hypothetical protein